METEVPQPEKEIPVSSEDQVTAAAPDSNSSHAPYGVQDKKDFDEAIKAQQEADQKRIEELKQKLGVACVPGEDLPAEHPLNQGELFSYTKEGPKFTDVASDSKERGNLLSSFDREAFPAPPPTTFSERRGLTDLSGFLDRTIRLAEQKGKGETLEMAKVFKRDLVYIGEPELQEALQGLASGIVTSAQKGESVYLYVGGVRSERYITLRLLEEVDQLTAEDPGLRQKVHFSEGRAAIAQSLKNEGGRGKVIVADDFSISGTRSDGFATSAFRGLLEGGFSPEEASRMIEIDLVADKINRSNPERAHKISASEAGVQYNYPVRTVAYYGLNESLRSDGSWNAHPGVSIAGSHCTTDYGYENVLDELWQFQTDQGEKPTVPLLHSVTRPYEMDGLGRNVYSDTNLQARWEAIGSKYHLSPQ